MLREHELMSTLLQVRMPHHNLLGFGYNYVSLCHESSFILFYSTLPSLEHLILKIHLHPTGFRPLAKFTSSHVTAQNFHLLCSILRSLKGLMLNLTVLLEYIYLYYLISYGHYCSI